MRERPPVCKKAMHAVRLDAGQDHYLLKLYERFCFIFGSTEVFEITGLPTQETDGKLPLAEVSSQKAKYRFS